MKEFVMLIFTQISRFTTVEFRDMIARFFGFLWYLWTAERREVVRENLKSVKGEYSESEVIKTFINFARVYSDILSLPNLDADAIQSIIKAEGLENLRKPLDEGRGAILVSAHLGGMELAGPYLSSKNFPLFSVAETGGPGMKFFRFYENYRSHLGNRFIALEDRKVALTLLRLLKSNKVVVLLGDRDIRGSGIDCKFFERKISLPRGITYLSRKTGAPVVVGFMALEEDSPRYLGKIFKPLYPEDYENDSGMLESMSKMIEKEIALYPHQWFVFQRIWKD